MVSCNKRIGMYYYGRRFYLHHLGRWLNRDPIEEEGGENLYAFCANNGIVYFDYLGMSFLDDLIDSAKVAVGLCGIIAGFGAGTATSWTGVGAVSGYAMIAIGIDQLMEGINSIYSRVNGGPASDDSPVKEIIRTTSFAITKQENSQLEQYLYSSYAGIQLSSSCYGGFVAAQSAVQSIKMTYVPERAVRVLIKQNGILKYTWRIQVGFWKISGVGDAVQSVFEILVDGATYLNHDNDSSDNTGE